MGNLFLFLTTKPTLAESDNIDNVYALTTDHWDPHSNVYAQNQRSMFNWAGNMVEAKHRSRIILTKMLDDLALLLSLQVSSVEAAVINEAIGGEG